MEQKRRWFERRKKGEGRMTTAEEEAGATGRSGASSLRCAAGSQEGSLGREV